MNVFALVLPLTVMATDWQSHFARSSANFGSIELPNLITPVTPEEAAKAIAAGYRAVVGSTPSQKVLRLLLGQWALETGNGASVHNYNFGNKKASASDPYHQYFRCSEVVNGVTVYYDPPSLACRFAAYQTAAEGAAAYVYSLRNRAHWWKGLQSGSISGFVDGLTTAPAYFTAAKDEYSKALKARADAFTPLAKQYGASPFLQVLVGLSLSAGLIGTVKFHEYQEKKKGR